MTISKMYGTAVIFNTTRGPFLPAFGLEEAGTLAPVDSRHSSAERLSVGFETLDRELFDPEECYELLGKSGGEMGALSERMVPLRKDAGGL
ncbi:MAG: hypothetical protein L6W00_09445 [Lentisphaeria bacterium]|nr:MAG: hypothetical protein L6W00_09445 [Lentisphaeria bacterium]